MARNWLLAFALVGAWGMGGASTSRGDEVLSEPEAARHGLTRAWFTQVQVDPSVGRITDIVVDGDMVFVQTDRAVLHAINAENGQTMWAQQIGDPHHPTMTPGVNDRMVAVANGMTLQVFNRPTGKLLWKTTLDGAPGAGPALSHERVYVPLTNGMVVSYRLKAAEDPSKGLSKEKTATKTAAKGEEKAAKAEAKGAKAEAKPAKDEDNPSKAEDETAKAEEKKAKAAAKLAKAEVKAQADAAKAVERLETLGLDRSYIPPLQCQSLGRTLTQPLVTRQTPDEEYVAWPTDQGYLYICNVNRQDQKYLSLKYRLETRAPIVAQPAYLPANSKITGDSGVIIGASQDGFVHAIREKDGQALWQFPTGEPISQPAAVIGQRVLVTNQLGGMYCLDAKTGNQVWWSPGIVRFMAASRDKVYSADKLGRMVVLDGRTGARLDTIAETQMLPIKPVNADNDRIYLASKTGLIQCLHETDLSSPVVHRLRPPEAEETPSKTVAEAGEKPRSSGGGGHAATPASSGSKKAGGKKGADTGFDAGGGKKGGKGKGRGGDDGVLGPGPGAAPPGGVPGGGKKKRQKS